MARFRDIRLPRATSRRVRSRALFAGGTALLALLLPGAVGAAWTTNVVQLDNGTCDLNLQIGSDKTASSSDTPSFWLMGDGGLSSYAARVDGVSIGTFQSAGNGNVCIRTTAPLADGPHTLTANELAPRPVMGVTPLAFTVDTVAPPTPSAPFLSAYTDSGAAGDGITRFRNINVTGSTTPLLSIQLSSGSTGFGGAKADSAGHWSATTTNLADGTYDFAAAALDSAGNRSALSQRTRVVVDSVPPPTPVAPTALEPGADSPSRVVAGRAAGDTATIRLFSDGTQIGAITPGRRRAWRYTLPQLTPGAHTIAVAAVDRADNVTPLSTPLSLTISAAPEVLPPEGPAPLPESDPRPPRPEFTPSQVRRPTPPVHTP